nr:peptidoglycan-binding protein [Methanobacterium aggregans]
MCVIFSVLPFAGAVQTSDIVKDSLKENFTKNTNETKTVADNNLKTEASMYNVAKVQPWFQDQGYYTRAINGSYSHYKDGTENSSTDSEIDNTWTTTHMARSLGQVLNNTLPKSSENGVEVNSSLNSSANDKASAKRVVTKTARVTVTKNTISGWFMPTGIYGSNYAYKWYYKTWLNYDPSSGQWGVLEYNPKHAQGAELTSSVTGVDYDGVSGYEKEYSPRWHLSKP